MGEIISLSLYADSRDCQGWKAGENNMHMDLT